MFDAAAIAHAKAQQNSNRRRFDWHIQNLRIVLLEVCDNLRHADIGAAGIEVARNKVL